MINHHLLRIVTGTLLGAVSRNACRVLLCIAGGFTLLSAHAETGRIGVSVTDLGNPFFVRVARAVESTARRVVGPEARVYVVSNAYNLKRQSEQIDDFIAQIKGKAA